MEFAPVSLASPSLDQYGIRVLVTHVERELAVGCAVRAVLVEVGDDAGAAVEVFAESLVVVVESQDDGGGGVEAFRRTRRGRCNSC